MRLSTAPFLRHACALCAFAASTVLPAQEEPIVKETPPPGEFYVTSGGEWNFTVPVLDGGDDVGSVVRFSPFFNITVLGNYDLGNRFGLFGGLTVRNLGFIYDDPASDFRYKYRTYNMGLPVGFKVGRMHGAMFYAGYEIELPFNYKEKRFLNERKEDKFNVWFSDRNEPWMQSVFMGVQGPRNVNLLLRYYLTNFHNTDYVTNVDGVEVRPYADLRTNLVCISIVFGLFNGERDAEGDPWITPPFREVQARR